MAFSATKNVLMAGKHMSCASRISRLNSRSCRYSAHAQTQAAAQQDREQDKQKENHTNPLHHPDYFGVNNLFTVQDLFEARAHYGHKEGSLNDKMRPFLFGSRLGHLIFDLDQTAALLRQALNVTAHMAYRGGIILFIGQSAQNGLLIEQTAKECTEFAHTRVWRPGMFTNASNLFGAVTRLPDLCIVLSTLTTVLDQHIAVVESAKMSIPTVAIVDTNCDPNLITYPVPSNDDTPCTIRLYCDLFKQAILKGKQERQKALNET